jgi:hypothetical protein
MHESIPFKSSDMWFKITKGDLKFRRIKKILYNIAVLNVRDRKTHNFKGFRNASRIIDEGLRQVQHQHPTRYESPLESD